MPGESGIAGVIATAGGVCPILLQPGGGDPIYALALAVALAAMGHEEFSVREYGSRTAAVLVRTHPAVCGPPISHLAGSSPCPETRRRCARICASPPYNNWLADSYTLKVRRWPTCDWGLARAGLVSGSHHYWFGQAQILPDTDEHHPGWARYRRASEDYVRAQIRCGAWTHADADLVVRAAWLAEMEFMMTNYPGQVAAVEAWSRP